MYNTDYNEDFYGFNIYNQDEIDQDVVINSNNNNGNINQFINYSLILLSNVFARLFR